MSLVDPLSCGFGKIAVFQILTAQNDTKRLQSENENEYKSRILKGQFTKYVEMFDGYEKFDVTYKQFTNNFPKILPLIRHFRNKTQLPTKDLIVRTFAQENWKKLSEKQKALHSLSDCKGCLKSPELKSILAQFPIKTLPHKIKAKKAGLFSPKVLSDITNKIVNELENDFHQEFNTSFVKEAKLHVEKFKYEKPDMKQLGKDIVKDCENQYAESSIERTFGTSISLRKRNQLRLLQGFESKESAKERSKNTNNQIKLGLKRPHNHIGVLDNYSWSMQECLQEVNSYTNDHVINFTSLARRYNLKNQKDVCPRNGGQILKQLLIENDCDISRFSLDSTSSTNTSGDSNPDFNIIRRKRRRLNVPNLTDVNIPVEETNEKVKEKLHEKIADGTYLIGEPIVPQTYEKVSVVDGKLVTENISVKGRKIPLRDIRLSLLNDHQKYMRLRTDSELGKLTKEEMIDHLKQINEYNNEGEEEKLIERIKELERRRNFILWHDCSTISSHSHFLIMVCPLYDPAVYFTKQEYQERSGQEIDIQATIEKPNIYILARCPSNDQQLLYTEERMSDLLEMQMPLESKSGILVKDVMRAFKGDNPAAQLEAGQQKGGHFFCTVCKIKASFSHVMHYSLNLSHISLSDRITKLTCSHYTTIRLKQQNSNYFAGLEKHQTIEELRERGIHFYQHQSSKELKELLNEEMHGIHRLPALLFANPFITLEEIGLEKYEILSTEPLHDISNHTKNLYHEIPFHFSSTNKKIISNTIAASFKGKEAKNSSDYRQSLLIVTLWLQQNHKNHYVTKLMTSLSEIQEILYLSEEHRSIKQVLRLINLTFTHAFLIFKHFTGKLKVLTPRKFYGAYYHSLTCHAADQYRLFSGRAINTEKEEATFKHLKDYSNKCSNHNPDHVISNAVIRFQINKKMNSQIQQKDSSYLTKLYLPIKQYLSNTVIPFLWIEKHSLTYQRLLQRQADYLLEGKQKWWRETNHGVEFLDKCSDIKSNLKLHHFRSSTITNERQYLEECWNLCLESANILIPAYKIKIQTEPNEQPTVQYLKTLQHFQSVSFIESTVNNPDLFNTEDNKIDNNYVTPPLSTSNITKLNKSMGSNVICDSQETILLAGNASATTPSSHNHLKPTNFNKVKIASPIFSSTPHRKSTSNPSSPTKKDTYIVSMNAVNKINTSPINNDLSKSANLLRKIFGEKDFVYTYDSARKKLKKSLKSKEHQLTYKDNVAVIEVELAKKKDELKKELRVTETDIFAAQGSKSNNEIAELRDKSTSILNQLKYIKYISKELSAST